MLVAEHASHVARLRARLGAGLLELSAALGDLRHLRGLYSAESFARGQAAGRRQLRGLWGLGKGMNRWLSRLTGGKLGFSEVLWKFLGRNSLFAPLRERTAPSTCHDWGRVPDPSTFLARGKVGPGPGMALLWGLKRLVKRLLWKNVLRKICPNDKPSSLPIGSHHGRCPQYWRFLCSMLYPQEEQKKLFVLKLKVEAPFLLDLCMQFVQDQSHELHTKTGLKLCFGLGTRTSVDT